MKYFPYNYLICLLNYSDSVYLSVTPCLVFSTLVETSVVLTFPLNVDSPFVLSALL